MKLVQSWEVSLLNTSFEKKSLATYCLVDRIVKVPEAVELLKEGLSEQSEKLQTEMKRLREVLEKPLSPKDMNPVIDKINNHVYYKMRRHLTSMD